VVLLQQMAFDHEDLAGTGELSKVQVNKQESWQDEHVGYMGWWRVDDGGRCEGKGNNRR
jgi:hypothetical protein